MLSHFRFIKGVIKRQFVVAMLLFIHFIRIDCQVDTVFWFAPPEISSHTRIFDLPITLRITTTQKAADIKIYQPANLSFVPILKTIPSSTTTTVDLSSFLNELETRPANQVISSGLLIESSANVTIYYEVVSSYCNCNPEIFTLKGQNALGVDFTIPTQVYFDNSSYYSPKAKNSFDIVATEDNTLVKIVPKQDIIGHAKGVLFNVSLNKGQTYSAEAKSQLASNHLAGSQVISNKPIAITVKDDLLEGVGDCEDLAGDQIVPSTIIGLEYIAVKGFLTGKRNRVSIVATQDGTDIYTGSIGTVEKVLNKGEVYDKEIVTDALYIRGTKPIYVWHTSGFGCELGGAILPPIECTGSNRTSFIRSSPQEMGVIVIVDKAGISNFKVNNDPNIIQSTDFNVVQGTNDRWYAGRIKMSTTQVPVETATIIENSSHLFHAGLINGSSSGGGARYGYFSNYSLSNSRNVEVIKCASEDVTLKTLAGKSHIWNNGSTNESITVTKSGKYWVSYSTGSCQLTDTFFVTVNTVKNFKSLSDTFICRNDSLLVSLGLNLPILWNDGSTNSSRQFIDTGVFWFEAKENNECPIRDTFTIRFSEIDLNLRDDSVFCDSVDFKIVLKNTFHSYLWHDGSANSFLEVNTPGLKWVEVENDLGCIFRDTIQVFLYELNKIVPLSDTIMCFGDPFFVETKSDASLIWNDGDTSKTRCFNKEGTYFYQTASECPYSDTFNLKLSKINTSLDSLINFCDEVNFTLEISDTFKSYHWFNDSNSHKVKIRTSGIKWVEVFNNYGCYLRDSIHITKSISPLVNLGMDKSFCEVRNTYLDAGIGYKYLWNTGSDERHIKVEFAGEYSVLIIDINGCQGVDTFVAYINSQASNDFFYFPNAFSPNGDGKNETFPFLLGQHINQSNNLDFKIIIYNRWGNKVWQSGSTSSNWQGYYGGLQATEGVYSFIASWIDCKGELHIEKGTFSLFR